MDLRDLGRWVLGLGLTLAAAGAVLLLLPKIPWLGRLPGDIAIERDRFKFYAPLGTSLLLSLVVSAILWLVNKWR